MRKWFRWDRRAEMTMANGEHIVTHRHNPNRTGNNKQALLKLTDDTYTGKYDYEALDVEVVPRGIRKAYRVTCIPFLTYGINKGDIVVVTKGIISKRITDDGQYGYRMAYPTFKSDAVAHKHIETILGQLKAEGFEVEEYGHKISAVNAVNAEEAVRLEKIFKLLIKQGDIIGYDTIC